MLVLSRYRDESIYVGDDIVITVVDIRGDRVRIGVQAPSDVSVHRKEIYEAIKGGSPKLESKTTNVLPSVRQAGSAPFAQELGKQKAKISAISQAIPVDIESPVEFGGLTDIVK